MMTTSMQTSMMGNILAIESFAFAESSSLAPALYSVASRQLVDDGLNSLRYLGSHLRWLKRLIEIALNVIVGTRSRLFRIGSSSLTTTFPI